MTAAVRHVRVNGWCHRCQGGGRLSVEHVDATIVEPDGAQGLWDGDDLTRVWAAGLWVVAEHVHALVSERLAELEQAHGCEGGAARAREDGRLQVVDRDMWEALGLDAPADLGSPTAT